MRSVLHLGDFPAAVPLVADNLIEFHASRILLLLGHSGQKGKIDGLTKLAKLDFFIRYPDFFEEAARYVGEEAVLKSPGIVESSMIRHNYGPWDKRYYDILIYLEARALVDISKIGNAYRFQLTERGKKVVEQVTARQEFDGLVAHIKQVKNVFGGKNGNFLKKLIYEVFDEEVASKERGEVIS